MADEQQKTVFRITRPPGGASSDIFGSSPTTTPPGTPRKVKNHMTSNIFTPDMAGGQGSSKTRQRLGENDSFNRLFGANGDSADRAVTSRGKNQAEGSIAGIFNADARANGHGTNGHANGHSNGTTNGHSNGTTNGTTNGATNGTTNGTANGITNGTSNGDENGNGSISSGASSSGSLTPNGSINGDAKSNGSEGGIPLAPSRRIPPGGYSSKLW